MTTTRKRPPHHLPLFFLGFWGRIHNLFYGFPFYWLMKRWLTALPEMKKKAGPRPSGDLGRSSPKSRHFPRKKKCSRRRRPLNHFLLITAIPRKGREHGIVSSPSCDGPKISRSRILRTTGSRPRSPLRPMRSRSGELTWSSKSFILFRDARMLHP